MTTGLKSPEIALNANLMITGDLIYMLIVLVHEQVHFFQWLFGKPSRNGYHNQEWADKCKEIGLQPFGPDGKETGQAIDTKLIEGGKAEKVLAEMLTERADEFVFPWFADPLMIDQGEAREPSPEEKERKGPKKPDKDAESFPGRSGKRDKYTCVICGASVWGKPGLHIACLDCNKPMVAGS